MNQKRIFKLEELLFITGFVPYLFIGMLGTTMFSWPSYLLTIARFLLIFVFAAIFAKGKFTFYEAGSFIVFFTIAVLVHRQSQAPNLIELTILMIGAARLNARSIIKTYVSLISLMMAVAFIASISGVIPNLQYIRPDTGAVRNSFGILYPTDFAAHIFYLYLAAAYLWFERKPVFFTSLGVLSSLILIYFSDARLDALTLLGAVFLFNVATRKSLILKPLMSSYNLIAFPFGFALAYLLTINYTSGSTFYFTLNRMLSGRLILGLQALNTYGIRPFGQQIAFLGLGGSTQTVLNYNFVDSSYIKLLLTEGWLFMVCLTVILVVHALSSIRNKDYMLMAVLIAIAINSMVAHHLIEPHYNIFIILPLADFLKDRVFRGETVPA